MKKLLIILFFIGVNSFSQNSTAILKVDSNVVDFGTIDQSANGRKIIKVTNTGNAPLILHEVKGSCGCVILDYPKKPILPNETAHINIAYNVLKLGKISRTVTILSNAKKKRKIIKVRGKVVKSL